MKNLLIKEIRLAASPLSFIFLAFALMFFLPGYPILCGAFFVCLGLFQSFQHAREQNDILYTLMLPIRKRDAVRAKYLFVLTLEGAALLIMAIVTLIRMLFMADAAVYTENALMAANPLALAFVLLIFLSFNVIFVGGFYRTAYKFGKPFVSFALMAFILIAIAETLHHLPGLGFLNSTRGKELFVPCILLIISALIFTSGTYYSCRKSQERFEKIDL